MKKTILAALAIAAMASCTKETETTTMPADGTASFTSTISRVSGTSWEDDDQVGIMVTDGSATLLGYKFNALYDVNPTTNAFSPNADADKFYYPVDETKYIQFYAYYPHSTAVTTANQYFPVNVAIQTTPKLIDFMEATTKGGSGYNKKSTNVPLTFNRRMTKITFTLVAGTGVDLDDITAITLEGFYTTANYDFATNSFGTIATVASITPYEESADNTYSAILIPTHDGNTAVTAHSTPKVKFVENGENFYWDLSKETLKAGDNNTYSKVTISRTGVTASGSNITNWNPIQKEDVTAE